MMTSLIEFQNILLNCGLKEYHINKQFINKIKFNIFFLFFFLFFVLFTILFFGFLFEPQKIIYSTLLLICYISLTLFISLFLSKILSMKIDIYKSLIPGLKDKYKAIEIFKYQYLQKIEEKDFQLMLFFHLYKNIELLKNRNGSYSTYFKEFKYCSELLKFNLIEKKFENSLDILENIFNLNSNLIEYYDYYFKDVILEEEIQNFKNTLTAQPELQLIPIQLNNKFNSPTSKY